MSGPLSTLLPPNQLERRVRSVDSRLRFLVHSLDHTKPIDLSDQLLSFTQMDRMAAPFSSWTAMFKIPSRKGTLDVFDAITDDDWVQVDQSTQGGLDGTWEPLQVGLIDGVRTGMEVDPLGVEKWVVTISGRGWMKVLTDTVVATLSKLASMGYSGSVLTVNDLLNITRQMAEAILTGTPPTSVLSDLVDLLLKGQWTVPASLQQQYLVAGAAGTSPASFAETFWDQIRPSVQTGGVAEVDGVVWRGVSVANGVRGSLWQLLQSASSDPALVELWPGWTRETDAVEPRIRPAIYFRKRPFDAENWAKLPVYSVPMHAVAGLDLGKSGFERWNVGMCTPAVGAEDLESLLVNVADLPYLDADGVRRHGTRTWFLTDSLSPLDDLNGRAVRQTEFVKSAYLKAPDYLNGTVAVVAASLPPSILGCRLRLTGQDGAPLLDFYAEGLDSRFSVGARGESTARQVLMVTRGQRVTQ